ncbi:hypothetical protein [Spirosoma aerophilum]
MPSSQYLIQRYNVHFDHTRGTGSPVQHSRTRFLHLRFAGSGNKPNNLFILSFIPDATFADTGDLTKLANGAYRMSARLPLSEFAAYYDLLRNEQPLSVWFEYGTEPAVGQTVPLLNFSLFSGDEPLGEGPADQTA